MYNLKLNGREEKKLKERVGEIEELEALNFEDVSSDDEWITKEGYSHIDTNEDWINIFDNSDELQARGEGDDVSVEFGAEEDDFDVEGAKDNNQPFESID